MKKLEPKQQRFVEEYLVDLNATQAYIRAGYAPKAASVCACQLLAKPKIQAAIQKLMEKRQERLEISSDKWLRELAIIGFSDIANYIDIDQDTGSIRAKSFDEKGIPEGASRALEMVKEDRMIREDSSGNDSIINSRITFKMHSKLDALKMIGQHLGFLKESKIDINNPMQVIFSMPRPGKADDGK